MAVSLYQVDAFASKPFEGNPAAVCRLDQPAQEPWMQAVAAEMNLSETAYLLPEDEGYRLRWFTPSTEVDLCGHATLGAAHVLWETGALNTDEPAVFQTASGTLEAVRDGDWIRMDFPAQPPEVAAAPDGLLESLHLREDEVHHTGRSRMDYLVQVDSAKTVETLEPDFRALKLVETRGVIVTAQDGDHGHDVVSRFFAPAAGVDEDPVTGSAHCTLAPFWTERLDRDELEAYQASPRGGTVRMSLRDDRVLLGGQAVTVLKGRLSGDSVPAAV